MAENGPIPRVEIVSYETEQVVKVVTVPPGASVERVDRGVNINLNHGEYFTRIVDEADDAEEIAEPTA